MRSACELCDDTSKKRKEPVEFSMRSTNFRSQGKFVKRFCSSENLKMQHITITWWQGRSCLRPRSGISLLGVCADTLHGKFSTAERTEGVVVTASSHCASG